MIIFELVVSAVTSILFLNFLVVSLKLQGSGNMWVSPGIFPAILSTVVLICSIIWVIDTVIILLKKRREHGNAEEGGIVHLSKEGKRLAMITILTALYILVLMPYIGFVFATIIFLFVNIKLFYGKWLTALIVSITMSGLMYLLFQYVLHLPMPR